METPVLTTIAAILAFLAVNALIYKLAFGKIRKILAERLKEVEGDLAGRNIVYAEDSANFFGQETLGMTQIRGNGIFRITDDEIYFRMLVPNKVFRFPLQNMTAIETPKSHLGKTKFVPLLKIIFTNEQGESDSAAWLVKNLDAAKQIIEDRIKNKNQTDGAEN